MLDDVDDCVFPPPFISTTIWGKHDEALVYDWCGAIDKALCFDFGLLTSVRNIKIQLDDDVPIALPMLKVRKERNPLQEGI
jgi:hypothetical protein